MYKVVIIYKKGKRGRTPNINVEMPVIPQFGNKIIHEKIGEAVHVNVVTHKWDKSGNYYVEIEAEAWASEGIKKDER